jgi:hypothetical protein
VENDIIKRYMSILSVCPYLKVYNSMNQFDVCIRLTSTGEGKWKNALYELLCPAHIPSNSQAFRQGKMHQGREGIKNGHPLSSNAFLQQQGRRRRMGRGVEGGMALWKREEGLIEVLRASRIEVRIELPLAAAAHLGAATLKGMRSRVTPVRMRTGALLHGGHCVEQAALLDVCAAAEVPWMAYTNASAFWTLLL